MACDKSQGYNPNLVPIVAKMTRNHGNLIF
jgi:hypothetical protein